MKQTLYRTSQDSPMFQALIDAAATKETTLVVELMARFDEASNIRWARSMEDAGVQVFHGVVGLKTHCKLAMLVRRDEDGVTRRYCHLGTGNYNPVTARFYTDLSLLTSDPQITERVHMVFNYLTAHAEVDDYRPLLVAPLTMAESFLGLIRREMEHARAGRPAHIVAKMNALLEPSVIEALYAASQAGVEVDLIIRGRVHAAARRDGTVRPHPRALHRGPVPRALADFPLRQRRRRRDLHRARPTGCRATCSSAAKWSFRFATRPPRPASTTRFFPRCWPTPSRPAFCSPMEPTSAPSKVLKDAPPFSSQDFLIQLAEGKADLDAIPRPMTPKRAAGRVPRRLAGKAEAAD